VWEKQSKNKSVKKQGIKTWATRQSIYFLAWQTSLKKTFPD
jgi:hypothetical protein